MRVMGIAGWGAGTRLFPFLAIWTSRMAGFAPWGTNCALIAIQAALRGMFYSEWIGLVVIVGGTGAALGTGFVYIWKRVFGGGPAASRSPSSPAPASPSRPSPSSPPTPTGVQMPLRLLFPPFYRAHFRTCDA